MKKNILVLLLIFVQTLLADYTVRSRVINELKRPVPRMKVLLVSDSLTTVTDTGGRFFFTLSGSPVHSLQPNVKPNVFETYHLKLYDFLGRWQRAEPKTSTLTNSARTTGSQSLVEFFFSGRGYNSKPLYLNNYSNLDSVVTMTGSGILVLAPRVYQSYYVGDTLNIFAENADSLKLMRVEFLSSISGKWIGVATPDCMVSTRFHDTCRFEIPPYILESKIGGTQDTLFMAGTGLRFRIVQSGDDSIFAWSLAAHPILKKPEAILTTTLDTSVSINDLVKLHGEVTDPFHETLSTFWQIGSQKYTSLNGQFSFVSPATADTTITCTFLAIRKDGTVYSKNVKVKVLWDYPVVVAEADTTIAVNTPAILHVSATDGFGTIKTYEWDFGNTGTWKKTATNTVNFPGVSVLNSNYIVKVRVIDDDGLASYASINLNINLPHYFPGSAGFISQVLPQPNSAIFFAGEKDGKVWLGQTDSLARILWSKKLSFCSPYHNADYQTVQGVLNNQGGVTLITRIELGSPPGTVFRILSVSLQGDSLWENTFTAGYLANAKQILQIPGGDYLIVYQELFSGGLARVDASGNLKWKQIYKDFDNFTSATLAVNGNVVLCGRGKDSIGVTAKLMEIDLNGNVNWTKIYNYHNYYFPYVIAVNNGYRLFGNASQGYGKKGVTSLRVDISGSLLDSTYFAYPHDVEVSGAVQAPDGGFYIIGNIEPYSPGVNDLLAMKMDGNGNELWHTVFDQILWGEVHTISTVSDGGVAIGGYGNFNTGAGPMLIPLKPDGGLR